MGILNKIPIRPGGMLTDIIETDLGNFQHQQVTNLRLVREFEWELPTGASNLNLGTFTNLLATAEFTDDASGDRFLLVHDDTTLKRINYDATKNFGYLFVTPSTLTLPSGVTISASTKLKFFVYRGVIRITGASEPLWYGYVDRTLFYGDDQFTVTGWQLEKTKVEWTDNDLDLMEMLSVPYELALLTQYAVFTKFFYVFDDSQYSLLAPVDNITGNISFFGIAYEAVPDDGTGASPGVTTHGASLKVRVPGSSLKNNFFNNRITGVGIGLYALNIAGAAGAPPIDDEIAYQVPQILNIDEDLGEIGFGISVARWVSTSPTVLIISDPGAALTSPATFLPYEAGYLGVDVEIKISFEGGSIDTVVSAIDFGDATATAATITVDDDLTSLFTATGNKPNVGFKVTRKWIYDASNGYHTFVAVDLQALGATYQAFTGIPQNTTDIKPNYRDHHVISGIARVSGLTGDEADSLRYSPEFQFDVFPIDNNIPVDVGDNDQIVRSLKLQDRTVIFKKKAASQLSFVGTRYAEDINFIEQGLYAADSPIVIGEILYWLDEDDAYAYDGNRVIPVFKDSRLRKLYRDNITTTSFISYNKLAAEIWFHIGARIMVLQLERGKWYERSVVFSPTKTMDFSFLGFDNILIIGTDAHLVTFNHSEATPNEIMDWTVTIKEIQNGTPRWHKKFKELDSYLQSNGDITVTLTDQDGNSENFDINSPSSLANYVNRNFFLYKELTITIANKTPANARTSLIREINPTVEVWKQ